MIDRAPQVAAFLVERQDHDDKPEALWAEMRRRWPGLTAEEGGRAAQIASEILAGTIAENTATYDAVEAAFRSRLAAAAVADWSEAEFAEIAAGTGIPLNAVRVAMQAIQRGDPVLPADDEPGEGDDADRNR